MGVVVAVVAVPHSKLQPTVCTNQCDRVLNGNAAAVSLFSFFNISHSVRGTRAMYFV